MLKLCSAHMKKNVFILLLIISSLPISSFAMECRQCDYGGGNCESVDCGRAMSDPCTDSRDGGRNREYCYTYTSGRQECFSCDRILNSDRQTGRSNDLHCEPGYIGSSNSGPIFITLGNTACTESEFLQATAFFGNWSELAKKHGIVDPVIPSAQALLGMIVLIFRQLNRSNPHRAEDHYLYQHLRNECALEYITKRCILENISHYCFKDFNGINEPKFHFKSEEVRKAVEGWMKQLRNAGF